MSSHPGRSRPVTAFDKRDARKAWEERMPPKPVGIREFPLLRVVGSSRARERESERARERESERARERESESERARERESESESERELY